MAYFKINDIDFSHIVSGLKVKKAANFNSQTNAAGNTVIDLINTKRTIEVSIVSINSAAMADLQEAISGLGVSISFRNPTTNALETINCFISGNEAEYYTIQANKVLYKPFNLTFSEL